VTLIKTYIYNQIIHVAFVKLTTDFLFKTQNVFPAIKLAFSVLELIILNVFNVKKIIFLKKENAFRTVVKVFIFLKI
jgi:hypothetical protein